MPGVTKEQIAQAKEWDLLSYLQRHEPEELKRCGKEYGTVSHGSLRISNGKWHWHSRGIGGRTALDYLIKVRGMGFVEAVERLCGAVETVGQREDVKQGEGAGEKAAAGQELGKPFALPPVNQCGTAVAAYLLGRGIDGEILNLCIGGGILYESRRYHNCVFVGRDPKGRARYAFQRGTYGEYKGDAEGSDKRYGFCLPAADRKCGRVAVAESPVDALSVATLRKLRGEDWRGTHYLSLGGTSPRALIQFLKDHPAVTQVSLCLDNDGAGLSGMGRIREAIGADRELAQRIQSVEDCPPPVSGGKDYNLFLQREASGLRRNVRRHGAEQAGMDR